VCHTRHVHIEPIDWHSLAVDRDSELPVGTQLAWKLQALIASGRLTPGERLPGVRHLAEEAGVNVNTVRSVYARLEEQGLVSSQHGRGTFVAGPGESAGIGRLAAQAAADARSAGIDPRAVAAALYADPRTAEPSPPAAHPPSGDDREYREELRRQVTELERQVAYYTRHTVGGPAAPEPRPRPTGRVLTAAELAGIRDELLQRVAQLRQAEEERRQLVAEVREELEREAEQERLAEIEEASRRRPTPDRPPSVVYGPSAWTLRWKA
jgi:DNA-binding transcriptional regulator YhcF (GntR family)